MTAIYDKARYTKIICFQLCLILISSAPSFAGLMRANTATHEFASKSLNVYTKTLLTEQTVGKFGFKTLEEARSARLGRPLTLMTVGLSSVVAAASSACAMVFQASSELRPELALSPLATST